MHKAKTNQQDLQFLKIEKKDFYILLLNMFLFEVTIVSQQKLS